MTLKFYIETKADDTLIGRCFRHGNHEVKIVSVMSVYVPFRKRTFLCEDSTWCRGLKRTLCATVYQDEDTVGHYEEVDL